MNIQPLYLTALLLFGLLLTACNEEFGSQSSERSSKETDIEAPVLERPLQKEAVTEFSVVAFNVENLFDLDGVALFDDYRQGYPENLLAYSGHKLLTKLNNVVAVLKTVDDGRGPDIILFQEFENDFSPPEEPVKIRNFLAQHRERSLKQMLSGKWREAYADISALEWMAKAIDDAGMRDYNVSVAAPKALESGIAHVNAVFSRFPIIESKTHLIPQARDIQEVLVSVSGNPLWLYNNHWKSGASDPKREPIRVENAKVLRRLIDARLKADPSADIIIGGDLNSHYNQAQLFPEIVTGINDVLGSSGDESFASTDLYNLWFELPPEARYSEVWRGRRGTLMHLVLSKGLYDGEGVSYVDSSFHALLVPDINMDALGRPLRWHAAGKTGGGTSDHFPVLARFRSGPFEQAGELSDGTDALDFEIPLRYTEDLKLNFPDGGFLCKLSDEDLAPYVNKLFRAKVKVVSRNPAVLQLSGHEWPAYIPDDKLYQRFLKISEETELSLVIKPGFWKGARQLIVEGFLKP